MILVVTAEFAGVGQATELDPKPRWIMIGEHLELTGRVVERGTGFLERHPRGHVSGTLSQWNR